MYEIFFIVIYIATFIRASISHIHRKDILNLDLILTNINIHGSIQENYFTEFISMR